VLKGCREAFSSPRNCEALELFGRSRSQYLQVRTGRADNHAPGYLTEAKVRVFARPGKRSRARSPALVGEGSVSAEKVSPQDLAALKSARAVLGEQQETERRLREILDEKPPENWRALAKGALTQDG